MKLIIFSVVTTIISYIGVCMNTYTLLGVIHVPLKLTVVYSNLCGLMSAISMLWCAFSVFKPKKSIVKNAEILQKDNRR